jgi:hypothetical protein
VLDFSRRYRNNQQTYSNCQFSKPHLKKGRRQRAEGRRKENPDLSFCLLPPALCLKLTELWLAQVKTAVNRLADIPLLVATVTIFSDA